MDIDPLRGHYGRITGEAEAAAETVVAPPAPAEAEAPEAKSPLKAAEEQAAAAAAAAKKASGGNKS